jgi:hypothetical protein
VILLENSNDWNLFPTKEGSSKKREKKGKKEQGLKSKRGETSYEETLCFKRRKEKKRVKYISYWERFYRKKERRSHFPIVQNLMCGLIHTHTSFVFALPSIH